MLPTATLMFPRKRGRRYRGQGGAAAWCATLLLSCNAALPQTLTAQDAPVEDTNPAANEAPPSAIPTADIPGRIERTRALIRDVTDAATPSREVEQIASQVATASERVDELTTLPEMAALERTSLRALYSLRQQWEVVADRLADWQQQVSDQVQQLEVGKQAIDRQRDTWQQTVNGAAAGTLPAGLVAQVRDVIGSIAEVDAAYDERLVALLTLGSTISDLNATASAAIDAIDSAEATIRSRLLVKDADALWHALSRDRGGADADGAGTNLGGELVSTFAQHVADVRGYLASNRDRVVAHVVLFGLLAAALAVINRRRRGWPGRDIADDAAVDIVARPVSSAALIALALSRYLYPGAPLALFDLTRILMVVPILVLVGGAFAAKRRPALYAFLGLFVLDVARELLQTQELTSRLSLLVLTATGCIAMLWAIATGRGITGRTAGLWGRAALPVSRLAVVTLGLSVVANIAGIVSLAELLGEGTILVIFFGFGLYALCLVLMGLVDLGLRSPLGRKVRAFRHNADAVHARIGRWLNLAGVLAWFWSILWTFKLWTPLRDGTVALFSAAFSVGSFTISLGDIAAFVIALWLGARLSRFVRFMLEEDVYTRVQLPRGVPATISMMVNYTIVTLAFFVALAVAGFDLSRFAIIAGALSVGIGFGLQNVVNNFVSGLILAFERPIQMGDSVEVGPLLGKVSRIGIRSSVVRTFDGSEVIVPNADFISKEVVNWTLSDATRRVILPVGVAYGSNPHQVIDVLKQVAAGNPKVLSFPEPMVLFVQFGESSLDFELRIWCEFSGFLETRTELNLAIHDALEDAGIVVPFPQRDVHVKSVDESAARSLPGPRSPTEAGPSD